MKRKNDLDEINEKIEEIRKHIGFDRPTHTGWYANNAQHTYQYMTDPHSFAPDMTISKKVDLILDKLELVAVPKEKKCKDYPDRLESKHIYTCSMCGKKTVYYHTIGDDTVCEQCLKDTMKGKKKEENDAGTTK